MNKFLLADNDKYYHDKYQIILKYNEIFIDKG